MAVVRKSIVEVGLFFDIYCLKKNLLVSISSVLGVSIYCYRLVDKEAVNVWQMQDSKRLTIVNKNEIEIRIIAIYLNVI